MYASSYYSGFYYAEGYPEAGQIYTRELVDNIALTDLVDRSIPLFASLVDMMGVSDTLTDVVSYQRVGVDTLLETDSITRASAGSRALTDNIGLTDSLTFGFVLIRELVDSLNLTDRATVRMLASGTNIIKFEIVDGFTLKGEIDMGSPKADTENDIPKGSVDSL